MTILTDEELNNLCRLISNSFTYDYYSTVFFSTIELSGCRPAELHVPDLWSFDGTYFNLQPLKGNNIRSFPSGYLPASFQDDVLSNNQWWTNMSVDKWNFLVQKVNPYPPLFVGNKEVNCGLFRHNRVRQMTLEGKTSSEIVDWFGWTNADMYNVYQFGDIYYI